MVTLLSAYIHSISHRDMYVKGGLGCGLIDVLISVGMGKLGKYIYAKLADNKHIYDPIYIFKMMIFSLMRALIEYNFTQAESLQCPCRDIFQFKGAGSNPA